MILRLVQLFNATKKPVKTNHGPCLRKIQRQEKSNDNYFGLPPPIFLLITHCCEIDKTLFTTQYSTSPDGKKKNITENMIAMNSITLAWIGSGGTGFSLVWMNIEIAITSGKM